MEDSTAAGEEVVEGHERGNECGENSCVLCKPWTGEKLVGTTH